MILHDAALRRSIESGSIVIAPLSVKAIQPASVDLCLGWSFKRFPAGCVINPRKPPEMEAFELGWDEPLLVGVDEFLLGQTIEWVQVPDDLLGRIDGRSTLGRLGFLIHATAGFFDPGFRGRPTLEIKNISGRQNTLWPGMRVCQMSFEIMLGRAEIPYGDPRLGSKYQGQIETTAPLPDESWSAFSTDKELSGRVSPGT